MTDLKINFHKPFAYNLSRCEEVSMRVATICNLDTLPFSYLALPIKITSLTRED